MARSPAMVSSIGWSRYDSTVSLLAVQRDHQFAEIAALLPGLDHRRAAVDDDRLLQLGVAVAADHHVDARHVLGQTHVLAVGVAPVLAFLQAAVAERDDHIHLLRLAQDLHHLPGGLGGIGEGRGAAAGVDHGLLAEHPEDAEADAAALDHEVAADHALLGQALEIGQRGVAPGETGIRGEHRRNPAGLDGGADGLAQAVGPEIEFMIAEGGGVVPHPAHELQLAAGLARRGAERRAHAVVARVEHQHRALALARLLPLRDQSGQPRVSATGGVVVERERRVVRSRTHADEARVHVVGVQDGEGLLPVRCRGQFSGQEDRRADAAAPARNSRRESVSRDRSVTVSSSAARRSTSRLVFMVCPSWS